MHPKKHLIFYVIVQHKGKTKVREIFRNSERKKPNMKKLIFVAILMLALVVPVAACDNDSVDPLDTGAATTVGENATVADPAGTTAADTDEAEIRDPNAPVVVIVPKEGHSSMR